MAFKQNLPVYGFFVVLAGIALSLLLYLQPSEEETLERVVTAHAQSLGGVQQVQRDGPVATLTLKDGRKLFLEFEKRGDQWGFPRDLFQEFQRTLNDPSTEAEVLGRLADRVRKRFRLDIGLKESKEGATKSYRVERDPQGGFLGQLRVGFKYPDGGTGTYVESFKYESGRWVGGAGQLLDPGPPPK